MDNILFANSKTCILLKETKIDFVVENGREVLNKVLLNNIPATMFSELLAAVSRGREPGAVSDADDFDVMRVSNLRRLCYEKGLQLMYPMRP